MTLKNNSLNKTISIIGLGKLGAPMAAAFASRGFRVIGVDTNKVVVNAINKKKPLFFEPLLIEYLEKYKSLIKTTLNYEEAILNSQITFIVGATPSRPIEFSTEYVERAARSIGEVLRKKKDYHLVVLISTVLPLSVQSKILPVLEETSGKKCGKDFGLCYSPELIALGSVIENLLSPDLLMIGESDKKAGDKLENFYRNICLNDPAIRRSSYVNVELAKIALNSFMTTKISFANFLAELCEKLPGGDVDVVTSILGSDSRIGGKYLKGGLGYGGPCFPRDNKALASFSRRLGVATYLPEANDYVNNAQAERVVALVNSLVKGDSCVGILGLSYKPDTSVVEESQGVAIAKLLSNYHQVFVYDPLAMDNVRLILGDKVKYEKSAKLCIERSDVVILVTPWPVFENLSLDTILFKKERTVTIVDCWRLWKNVNFPDNIRYIPLGKYQC